MLAGMLSTTLFAASTLPMLVKAVRTRDLESYSLGNLALSNVGNVFHSVYVFSLPAGPIWALHGFYLVSAALMLFWYLRHAGRESAPSSVEPNVTDHVAAHRVDLPVDERAEVEDPPTRAAGPDVHRAPAGARPVVVVASRSNANGHLQKAAA